MAFRIQQDESVTRAVRRVVREQLDGALATAVEPQVAVDERIHEVRLALKRARAALALVRPEVGHAARRDNRALREVAWLLAPWRDRAVARETLSRFTRQLGKRRAPGSAPRLTAHLREELAGEGAEACLREVVLHLRRVHRKVGRFRVPRGRRAVGEGLEATYRRARRAFRRVREHDDAERFHEWRKATKRLGYQAALIRDASPAFLGALEPLLERLSKRLGELHDLAFLRAVVVGVGRAPGGAREQARWLTLLDARAADLRGEARALGRELYAEGPSTLRRRIEADWASWRT